jgi:hypothetical protein
MQPCQLHLIGFGFFPDQPAIGQPFLIYIYLILSVSEFWRGIAEPLPQAPCFGGYGLCGGTFPRLKKVVNWFSRDDRTKLSTQRRRLGVVFPRVIAPSGFLGTALEWNVWGILQF